MYCESMHYLQRYFGKLWKVHNRVFVTGGYRWIEMLNAHEVIKPNKGGQKDPAFGKRS